MDIERLKEFILINETGSFKAASDMLDIAPSVLSARFKNFESSLGCKLLERNNHYVKPTEKGMMLLKNATELVQSWETAKLAVRNLNGSVISSLKIQLCAQSMPSELGPFMDIYSKSHPWLFLDLYDENNCTIRDGLMSGQTDLVFVPGKEQDFEDIEGKIILSHFDHLTLHVPLSHRLSTSSAVSFNDLSGENFILYPRMKETHIHDLQLEMLERSGISYHIYENSTSPYFYDLLVPIGKGLQFWNWTDRVTPNTVNISVRDSGYDTYYYMLYNPDNNNPIVHEFINLFLNYRKARV
jgi:DNA-binding transcriptional LysR family regulator